MLKSEIEIKNLLNDCEDNEFDIFYGCSLFVALDKYSKDKCKLDSYFWALISRIEQHCYNLKKYIKFQSRNTDYKDIMVIDMNTLSLQDKLIMSHLIASRYYQKFSQRGPKSNTVNLIIDEAHKILSLPHEGENNNFEEYIKEGGKFGYYLTIASQRPSDISSMFFSQMHNYFVHRLVNQNDINTLSNAISFLDDNSFSMISSLKVGTCICSGIATKFPIVVNIPKLEDKISPYSNNISIISDAKIIKIR